MYSEPEPRPREAFLHRLIATARLPRAHTWPRGGPVLTCPPNPTAEAPNPPPDSVRGSQWG